MDFVDDLGVLLHPLRLFVRTPEVLVGFKITVVTGQLELASLQKARRIAADGGAGAAHIADGDAALRRDVFNRKNG